MVDSERWIQLKKFISNILIFIIFVVAILFIFEFYGEMSAHVEGVFITLGIKWRYPLVIAIASFLATLIIKKRLTKLLKFGLIALSVGIGLFVLLYIVALFSFMQA
jgi:hypothetical protein